MILIIFLMFVILILLGVPIVYALLVPGIATCVFYPEIPLQLMNMRLANAFFSSSLLAIPLFILAAQILTDIKVCDSIFGFLNKCVGYVRGGLAHVNVLASVVFAGMSGSAVADAAGLGKVEIDAMKKQGYTPAFAAAVTAASSTIGPIMPPSIAVIVYGALAGVSMGKLLIGGFIPALIMAIAMMIQISVMAKRRGFPKTKFVGFQALWKEALQAIPGLMAPVILIGGILSGLFTPTEAATMAVGYAIIVGFSLKTLTIKELWHSCQQAAVDSAAVLITFFGAGLISVIVTRLHIADAAISFISSLTSNPQMLLLYINILFMIIGCFMGVISALMIFTPILVPLVQSFGIDLNHFGIMMILNLMIGGITPPMGGLMFVTCKVAEVKLTEILKEVWPFIISLVIALLIVTYVPQTVTWLPSLFIK